MHARAGNELGSLAPCVLRLYSFEYVVLRFLPFCAHQHKNAEESLHILCEHTNDSHTEELSFLFSSNPGLLV